MLLLLVQSGAASLLAVAVLLQRVKHLIGQLEVHPQTIAHVHLWSELQEERPTTSLSTQQEAQSGADSGRGYLLTQSVSTKE